VNGTLALSRAEGFVFLQTNTDLQPLNVAASNEMSNINLTPDLSPSSRRRESKVAGRSVLIVGVGGLGVPAAVAAVRAGVGKLGLIDPDPVELSNLHRQVIYGVSDIGTPKVTAAQRWLRELGAPVEIETHHCELNSANARSMIGSYDFTIDATDSPLAKFLVNDTCVALGRPFAYGGVLGMTGQMMTILPGRTACLRCLFEEPPDENEIASCRDAGIIGPIAGAIGEAQAAEALRYLRGQMPALAGIMLTYDANGLGRIRLTPISARPGCGCGAAAGPGTSVAEPR
jgi:molybdopterin-synthase adenylyltransferase